MAEVKFTLAGKYAAHSDCARYAITWNDVVPPYHAHTKPKQRDVYGANLGAHESREAAKEACANHDKGARG